MTYLLDANVLIALTFAEHQHHDRASHWAETVDSLAICPIVEGALIRFTVRLGEPVSTAVSLLRHVRELPACEFWPDEISYVDIDLAHVIGHRQVADAYLAALALSRGARLATLDESLVRSLPAGAVLVE